MNKGTILQNIAKHIQLSEEEEQYFLGILNERKLKKRQYFLYQGQVAKQVAFVTSGCLRAYSIDKNGFEHIIQFAPTGWWITDMGSFISETEGMLNIDALEDTSILFMSRQDQLQLFNDIPQFERFFRILTEKALVSNRMRLLDYLSLSVQERYTNFCTQYPTLINTLPQKQIASYIGVTPEFLSKIRSESSRKERSKNDLPS